AINVVWMDCPVCGKLDPLLRVHLPFGTMEETVYRALSMYLTAQYLLMRQGKTPDWDLRKLVEIYRAVNDVNRGISNRLASASEEDANTNAVVILSAYAEMIPFSIERHLAELEYIF